MGERDYTVKQVAHEFQVDEATIYRLVATGQLEAYYVGTGTKRRAVRVTAQSVSNYKKQNRFQAGGVKIDEEDGKKVA